MPRACYLHEMQVNASASSTITFSLRNLLDSWRHSSPHAKMRLMVPRTRKALVPFNLSAAEGRLAECTGYKTPMRLSRERHTRRYRYSRMSGPHKVKQDHKLVPLIAWVLFSSCGHNHLLRLTPVRTKINDAIKRMRSAKFSDARCAAKRRCFIAEFRSYSIL